jgi:GAF domain-containing protein
MAAFPILHQGRAIGALTIYAGEPSFFDMENVALLAELAADISFGQLYTYRTRICYAGKWRGATEAAPKMR